MLRLAGSHEWPLPDTQCARRATWSFTRGAHKVEIRTSETAFGFLVTITVDGLPESNAFRDESRAERFRSGMESALLAHGWTLTGFSPDHRSGNDRRVAPRPEERRRSPHPPDRA
jgi:hypothetical protein